MCYFNYVLFTILYPELKPANFGKFFCSAFKSPCINEIKQQYINEEKHFKRKSFSILSNVSTKPVAFQQEQMIQKKQILAFLFPLSTTIIYLNQ